VATNRDTPFHLSSSTDGPCGLNPGDAAAAAVRHPEGQPARLASVPPGERKRRTLDNELRAEGTAVPRGGGCSAGLCPRPLAYHSSAADPQPATGQSSTTIQAGRPAVRSAGKAARRTRRGACAAGRMAGTETRPTVKATLVEVAAGAAEQARFDAALSRAAVVISSQPPAVSNQQSREPLPPITFQAGGGGSPPLSAASSASKPRPSHAGQVCPPQSRGAALTASRDHSLRQPSESVQAGGSDTPSPPSAAPNSGARDG